MNTTRAKSRLSITLAGMLSVMPMVRSVVVPVAQFTASPSAAIVFRWVVGAVGVLGFDAVSKASSIAISPPSATIGVQYQGTITYSGGHAGSVYSFSIGGVCLSPTSSYTFDGLTVTYKGSGNVANVSGIPSGSTGTISITATVTDGSGCSGGLTDTRSTSLIIQNSGGGPTVPTILVPPNSILAQVGSDVILSGGASGNPVPGYFWRQGLTIIPGQTNNTLLIPSAQWTNCGDYSLIASNSQGEVSALCVLTMAITPGSNSLSQQYTNYAVAGQAVTMYSLITNVPSATNTYSWQYNTANLGVTTSNLTLSAAQAIPINSGIYAVTFNSIVSTNKVVVNQQYISYWTFGYPPTLSQQPTNQTVSTGANATFAFTVAGGTYPSAFLYQNQTTLVAETNFPSYNPSTAAATTNISFTISNVTSANAGTYTVVVTNFWGSTTSSNITLTVPASLSVTTPAGQTNYAGKNVSLSVTASGTAPLAYQWQKGGVNLANGGELTGVFTNLLSIAPAETSDSGNYQVVVTNSSGSVTSGVAAVSIVQVPRFVLAHATSGTGLVLDSPGGLPGSTYIVEASTNVSGAGVWTPIFTNTAPANGSITFTNPGPLSGNLFYRVEFP